LAPAMVAPSAALAVAEPTSEAKDTQVGA
jgi:hypothetical protein